MNKRLYIVLMALLFIGVVGCQKIDIKPHTNCEEGRVEQSDNEKANRNNDEDEFDRDRGDGDLDLITDPNRDEDEDEQIKR